MVANSSYVTLFGGPWDGRRESVLDGCNILQLNPPIEFPPPGKATGMAHGTVRVLRYIRSREDPTRFVFDETVE